MDEQSFNAIISGVQGQGGQSALVKQLRGQHDLGSLYSMSPTLSGVGQQMQKTALSTAKQAGDRRQQGLTRARQKMMDEEQHISLLRRDVAGLHHRLVQLEAKQAKLEKSHREVWYLFGLICLAAIASRLVPELGWEEHYSFWVLVALGGVVLVPLAAMGLWALFGFAVSSLDSLDQRRGRHRDGRE